MSRSALNLPPLYSELAEDPDFAELVEMFVGDLPKRMQSLESAHQTSDRERLRMVAHQLKGAAGSYGFGPITDAALQLESALRQRADDEQILTHLQELLDTCRRARPGCPE